MYPSEQKLFVYLYILKYKSGKYFVITNLSFTHIGEAQSAMPGFYMLLYGSSEEEVRQT